MSSAQTTVKTTLASKAKKDPVKLGDRIKTQLNAAILRNKITADELNDLEQHVRKVAGLLA
ncbi:MAG: hypothetical protein ABI671_14140 [Burkholderiales bacterium]